MSYNKKNLPKKCLECDREFDELGGLHKHVKVHKLTMGDYYVKHFPRKSLLTKEQLPFKEFNQYFNDSFVNKKEEEQWIKTADKDLVKRYILYKYRQLLTRKDYTFVPFYNYSKTCDHLPDVEVCRDFFGSYSAFCKEVGQKPFFKKGLPKDFWTSDPYGIEFMIDTREQIPFAYPKSFVSKVEIGDYTATGDDYDYTYVDRKSMGDFLGTMSAGNYLRFKKEMERCRLLDSKIFVVVEGTLEEIVKKKNSLGKQKAHINYIWNNMRTMQIEYRDVCQFVFCLNREDAADVSARILKFGRQVWDCDLQYFINNR